MSRLDWAALGTIAATVEVSKRPTTIAALSVALVLAGCAVGPDYVKPKVDKPDAYRFAEQETQDTANTEWWKQFDDPVLDSLITEALANNKNVKIAAANVEQAAGVLTTTRSEFFPQVNYNGSVTRQRASEQGEGAVQQRLLGNPSTTYQVLAGASWELDLWGRVRRLTEAAQANLLATEQARRGVILSLVAQVASTYLQLRGLDYQLEIANKSLTSYGDTVALFEKQFKYGSVSQMNVEQARSSYETAAAQIPQIESQIAQTENSLAILLGRNPGDIPRGKSIQELNLPVVPAGLPSELLERRPDIAQAEQSLIAANAQIGAAKAQYFPTISLTGAFGNSSRDLHDLFTGPARVWSFAGQLAGPIFTGGAIKGQVAQATAGQKAALFSYEATIQSAFADVDNALVSRRKLIQQQAAEERLVRSLSEYERLARLQYNGGYTPYSTVLQAQQSLFPQELTLAQTRASVYNSLVTLYKVTGGGWVEIAEKTSVQPPDMKVPAPPVAQAQNATAAAASKEDRIEVQQQGDVSIVNVYRVGGIGGAQLKAPKSGWPPAVVVRMHGFPAVESFRASSGAQKLECAQIRPEGQPPRQDCRLGSKPVDASSKASDYLQFSLPSSMLTADGGPVELHWVDQWR
jgi:multidrug efflux system outer membrane protein